MQRRPIVLTLGEPSGIGPEITIKAKKILKDDNPFFVLGNYTFISAVAKKYGLETKKISDPSETYLNLGKLCIIDYPMPEKVIPGHISSKNSAVIPKLIRKAVTLVQTNYASALVTNPINKWALKQNSSFQYEGHTDFLAALDKKNSFSVMMLASNNGFRVVPVTVHIPIKHISKKLTSKLIEQTILIVNESLKVDFKIKSPNILITGLNPHAGENSAMGYEEIDVIIPTVKKLKKIGLNLIGPISADTAFTLDKRTTFDAFICMYHDQALIPIKTTSFDECINITLGLSFVRTSPDHGTALDIAGAGTANPNSLILAIKEAQKIVNSRANYAEED